MQSKTIDPEARRLEDYAMVYMRAGNACEICGIRGENVHHRKPRGMGGSIRPGGPENLMLLCGSGTTGCHGWIEKNRDEARTQGWLVRREENPSKVPVSYRGQWVLLTYDGTILALSGLDQLLQPRPRSL